MLTWRLWNALRRPPTWNPVFRRAFTTPDQPLPWHIGCLQWIGVVLFLPIIVFAANIYGLGWSVGIANLLGKEREGRTFDLLSLCPPGPLGMSWALATGYLFHHRTFKSINDPLNLTGRLLASATMFTGFGIVITLAASFDDAMALEVLMVQAVALGAALFIDHIQSLVLAALTGLLAPLLATNRVNAQLYAFTMYVAAQLATYLVTFLIGFNIVPGLLATMGARGPLADIGLIALRLAIFYLVREAILTGLWSLLREQLNADASDAI